MNILVIKHSSLGDVLHSTGHIRTLRETFPQSTITLLTSPPSNEMFLYNKNVDHILIFQKDRVKYGWKQNPIWLIRHFLSLFREVRKTHYDLAFDLQGRLKSVVFLYVAKAEQKFVKGRWPFLKRFKKPEMHAIREMDQVLKLAGIDVKNSDMEIHTSTQEKKTIEDLLSRLNPQNKKILLISPFTRWNTKNWEIEKYLTVINQLGSDVLVLLTGLADKRKNIDRLVSQTNGRSVVHLWARITR